MTVGSGWEGVVLRGPRLTLRLATEADVPALAAVLGAPEVARWWDRVDEASVRELLSEDLTFAIEAGGRVVGIVLCHEELDPTYKHATLDISLHPDFHDQGFGREALGLLADHLIEARGHHRITIDPAAINARAIRCYEAVGFRPVGVMRQYERDPSTPTGWRDGLLMELLATDRH